MRGRRDRQDRATIENLEAVLRLAGDLRREFLSIVDIAEDVSISSGMGGSSGSTGSHSDPTAREALDGRRAARRHALKEIRKASAAALDDMQRAAYHGRRAQSESPGLWSKRE